MAEAEDVITDAARHATIYAQRLWQRHRAGSASSPRFIELVDVADRISWLIQAVFQHDYRLRVAQPRAPTTLLTRLFRRHDAPFATTAIPANDGVDIWLPPISAFTDENQALSWYRTLALQQAMRIERRSAFAIEQCPDAATRAVYVLLEAQASDKALLNRLPGLAPELETLRARALAERRSTAKVPTACRPIEKCVRMILSSQLGGDCPHDWATSATARELTNNRDADSRRSLAMQDMLQALERAPSWDVHASLKAAARIVDALYPADSRLPRPHANALTADYWIGELRPPPAALAIGAANTNTEDSPENDSRTCSARLRQQPSVRKPDDEDEDETQGVWMIQTAEPNEKAENPMGNQRPTDRDDETAAEEFADALSELNEARLVSRPGQTKEILLSDDEFTKRSATPTLGGGAETPLKLQYPEWDYRRHAYQRPGTTVHIQTPQLGPQAWVDRTLAMHQTILKDIRRRFEAMRPDRIVLHRQLDGDDIDLSACIEGLADLRAQGIMPQGLYQQRRQQARELAITLLIDISGSTDSWLSANNRIIDVEREALLLVCIALQHLGELYSVHAFSGEGPQRVTISPVKQFDERYDNTIAQRIAALEPQHYTRAGAALRHCTSLLMKQPARHRLLLLLSDGKPNDVDQYEGRYGIEDMRQAVNEALMQGIIPFCLTIDRQAASYLPKVFGAHHYALLPKPDMLPTVLLEWMRRLMCS